MGFHSGLTALALNRFGLGGRPKDLAFARSDPRGFFADEVKRKLVVQPTDSDLLDTPAALAALREQRQVRREARARTVPNTNNGDTAGGAMRELAQQPAEPPVPQRLYRAEVRARLAAASVIQAGYIERLVWFWANHFAVSAAKGGPVRATAGAFEREAIRPHVLGRFSDMLLAVETHPTMLFYLDNQLSIGPGSVAGRRRGRGLNENLAREILELHTVGVGGGYAQKDVTNLAKILTGWTIAGPEGRLRPPGTFAFNPNWHEPGDHVMLGRRYGQEGPEQGRAALLDLARQPATAKHVAFKLARHFVRDEPPPELVAKLASVFRDSDGDLAAVSLALLDADEAWDAEATKIRSPHEFLVAALRLLDIRSDNPVPFISALVALGQPLWAPPGPNGFPDTVAHWVSPEGIKTRLDIAARMVERAPVPQPVELFEAAEFGGIASRETREAVARAESRSQGIALLLMSPEFQRR